MSAPPLLALMEGERLTVRVQRPHPAFPDLGWLHNAKDAQAPRMVLQPASADVEAAMAGREVAYFAGVWRDGRWTVGKRAVDERW